MILNIFKTLWERKLIKARHFSTALVKGKVVKNYFLNIVTTYLKKKKWLMFFGWKENPLNQFDHIQTW